VFNSRGPGYGTPDKQDRIEGIRAGADDFLTRPVDRIELLTRVRSLLALKRAPMNWRSVRQSLQPQMTKLEAFSYSVSHDLRAPLRHINGDAGMLIKEHGPQLVPEAQLRLKRIQEGTEKMGGMIDDLLNLARLDRRSMDLQMTSLNSLVKNVLHDLESETTDRKIDWRIGSLPSVNCDPGLIQQVFANLLSNAVKYTRLVSERSSRLTSQQATVNLCFSFATMAQDSIRNIPRSFLEHFSGFTPTKSLKAPAWALPRCSASSENTGTHLGRSRDRQGSDVLLQPR